jgi:hypothetical protein
MEHTVKNRSGSLKPNSHTKKHAFYSKFLDEQQRRQYTRAVDIEGLDAEIALLRVKIQSLLAHDPENIRLISQALNSLARMIMTKYHIKKTDTIDFSAAMRNALQDITLPTGFQDLPMFKK